MKSSLVSPPLARCPHMQLDGPRELEEDLGSAPSLSPHMPAFRPLAGPGATSPCVLRGAGLFSLLGTFLDF